MSRYLLLFLLNAPLVMAALLNAVVNYKVNNVSKNKFLIQVLFWLSVLIGLGFAHDIYTYLFNHKLTASEPLSLFDVIQITALIILLYTTGRIQVKLDKQERRLQDLHQELSIILSGKPPSAD